VRRQALVAATAAVLLAPVSGHAFIRSSSKDNPKACLFWPARQPSFSLNADGSFDAGPSSLDAARRSFQPWTELACTDLTFKDLGTTSLRRTENDQVNLVLWRERTCTSVAPSGDACFANGGCDNLYDCWEHGDTTIALTSVSYNSRTGVIVDVDIELNGAGYVFTTVDSPPCSSGTVSRHPNCVATDVQNTLTHEIGHFLGLDHVSVPDATMFSSAPIGETSKRTLYQDDIDGLCTIYPRGQPPAYCVPQGSDVIGMGCGCGDAGGLAPLGWLAPLALGWFGRRRSRRAGG
jgi:hypothetical protein